MAAIIKKLDRIISMILEIMTILMLSVMSIVVFAQVIFRLFHASIPWSEELSKYLLIWCTFLGSALCVRKGALVGLEIMFSIVPKKHKKLLQVVIQLLSMVFLGILVIVGYKTSSKVWLQTTPVLKLSMGLMYAAVPTGALFMLINTFFVLYETIFAKEEEL